MASTIMDQGKCQSGMSLNLDTMDLDDIRNGLENGEFSSQDLVDVYLARIMEVNDKVRAMATLNPEAKLIAIERDQQRSDGKILGALHGVPFLVKDTFITLDEMDTTGGSYALVGAKYATESTIVSRLRNAGAILLGKTNLSQWGMARSPKCPSGWSALFGQAIGGFHEDQDPQGSSSGSAIAASMSLASFCLGGETCGSILYPAQRNGIVGLKPTVGLTSRSGTIPLNPEHDSIGPLTRYVKDSAIILQAIAGKDPYDEATADIPFGSIPNYADACTKEALAGVRVAVPLSVYRVADSDPEVGLAFREAVAIIRSLGAVVVDDIDFETWKPNGGQREDLFGDVLLREAYEKFFGQLATNPHQVKNISDLIEFTKATPEEQYERFGAGWFESGRDAPIASSSAEFAALKSRMEQLGEDLVRLLDKHNCDLLLASSSTDLPLDLGRLPGISVPLGFYSCDRPVAKNSKGQVTKGPNIPFAITFASRRFTEKKLIACAYAFEQATMTVQQNRNKMIIQAYEIWYSPQQEWYYLKQQTTDEVLLMMSADSETLTRCAHTAFEDPNTLPDDPKRRSIELRCMVFF